MNYECLARSSYLHVYQKGSEMLTQQHYRDIKHTLNFKPAPWVSLGLLGVDALLVWMSAWLLRRPDWGSYLASQVLLACVFFHGFALLHEAGHGNVARNPVLNHLVGMVASLMCCMPYWPWVYIHTQHHIWVGNVEKDPTAANLKRWRAAGRIPWVLHVAWRYWIPLGAAAQHVVFLGYPLKILGDKRKFWPSVCSVAWVLGGYLALRHWFPGFMAWRSFALAIPLYLWVEELINFPHHSDLHAFSERLPLWEQWRASRSCHYPWLLSEALWLNFNYHTEHHLYPSLPWWRLRGVRGEIKGRLGGSYHESMGISWNLRRRTQDIEEWLL